MNFKQSNGKSIEQAFSEFHKENPHIYEYFKDYFQLLHIRKGIKKVSSKLIINRIRWEVTIKTTSTDYKINDAFTAHYARLFVKDYPQYIDCFEFRRIRSFVPVQGELFQNQGS